MYKKFLRLKKNKQRFIALIIGIGVILVWRGFWGLADIYLFPQNPPLSHLSSILIGLLILVGTHHMIKGLT